mmetsp:Transcript_41827/g.115270  ORF Transcript_41827/g.115270 Transcript_41827/m.115270 type:complete len:202 (+) Transcript_41827:888-1493(+)
MSKVSVLPARGGFASRTAAPSALIAVTTAGILWPPPPSITRVPFSKPGGTSPASIVMTSSSLRGPYASAGGNDTFLASPTRIPRTALSKPGTTCPAPTVMLSGSPPSVESNTEPSSKRPVYSTRTSSPSAAGRDCSAADATAIPMQRRTPGRRGTANKVPAAATAATTRRLDSFGTEATATPVPAERSPAELNPWCASLIA